MSPKCNEFQPHHINICSKDIEGNNGLGRYIFLPGSDGRAKAIAEFFGNLEVIPHPRSHNFYKGTLKTSVGEIDVASVSSGMGCPSIDIIVNELYNLGARRLLRVGTAGSVQPQSIRVGHLVIPTASVRDEGTSTCYTPPEVPAVASAEIVSAIHEASRKLKYDKVSYGIVHSKDSLFAREFKEGPMAKENKRYMDLLHESGVLASEMECSHLFILGEVFNQQLRTQHSKEQFLTGGVLSIIGDDSAFEEGNEERVEKAIQDGIMLSLETIKCLAERELA